ncbi:PREDICTED: protein phosphatase 1 regulatory subunit 3C-like [Ceratosolen solmsi marchali]|uniref:Protein phosphatase 1 regulatory subunit 3C-like n=1 Tax=Ceratosolen solmsi marchali TaxID=326594 RepID=A0AAJ6YFH6_9HYME|nr:PREDICTED: protein phosphatase 1 regulatory subunit 3C-like [Ceratosolen solmsi marchali]XP_011497094.1 PREDICTED: protein phosphatase 1 regulatory subunit 3C-like [Ceratosolen solmsi marchali]
MCSIARPSELLLGHSPPVYGSLLYNSLMVTTPSINNRSVPPQIRPCLASTSIHLDDLIKNNDVICNKRNKKRVVFADDRGRPLTQVRIMSEPSNMPPLWTHVASLTRGDFLNNFDSRFTLSQQSLTTTFPSTELQCSTKSANINLWEPIFSQPASDYLAFRDKLEKESVSLENVIVRNSENNFIGTVKVKNFTYNKDVTIRMTIDNWKSYEDVSCVYIKQSNLITHTAMRNLYDTFHFRILLPINDGDVCQIEFCVHYVTDGSDFWDNNAGSNYVIKKNQDVRR